MTTLIAEKGQIAKRARGSTPRALSPSAVLAGLWAAQHDRWILWTPVAMIAGAAWWINSPRDPPLWIGAAALAGGAALAAVLLLWPSRADGASDRARRGFAWIAALVAMLGLGAAAAQVRALSVAELAFVGSDAPLAVEGWVSSIEPSQSGPRLRLLVRSIEGVEAPPRYVRVSVPQAGLLTPGRAARCRAVLGPPAPPLAPGAYDFARRAYFERLGATGFAYGRCRPIALAPPPLWADRIRLQLAAVRADLSAAIQDSSPGRGGALAAAMVAGDRSPIDEETNTNLQNSGLGHLLSVSGVHMGVVGGIVFAALIWTLSLIGPLALRWPVKKLAAIGALAALAAYLIISGSSVPALRSFVMAGVAFGAILLDRPAISMRGLALAALVVLLAFPESAIDPSFQMSFAATMALVALFEILHRGPHERDLPAPGPLIGGLQGIARGIGGVILISLTAGLATDPFALYHFQRFSLYALPSNLVTAPIMSFLVAPAAAAAAVLAPFGWADPALDVMASGLDLVAAIGDAFGARPEAVRALPQPPHSAFILSVAALLWACLWRGPVRWGGALLLAAAFAVYASAPRPVAAFDSDLRAVFGRDSGAWRLSTAPGRSTFARDRLGAMLGLSTAELERLAAPDNCTEDICTWRIEGRDLLAVGTETGLAAACRRRAIVLTTTSPPLDYAQRCGAILLSQTDLTRLGGGLIYADGRITRATPRNVRRPWTPLTQPEAGQE